MLKKIYLDKINYYNNPSNINKYKLKKYFIKLSGGATCTQNLEYDMSRTPSNCDRILYKSNILIPTNYGVYILNNLIRLSDHLLVYGEFLYNNKKGIIFTWNIAGEHSESNIQSGIAKLIIDFKLLDESLDYSYIIFCLQESSANDLLPKILINGLLSTNYKVSMECSHSLLGNYDVRLIIFHKIIGVKISQVQDYNTTLLPGISSTILNLESRFIKSLLNNKTCIAITIDDLTIISCHFPLDTTEKDMGNELRIKAMKQIKEQFKDSKNILLAGDLNFRIVDNKDQLTEYLKKNTKFTEFTPPLKEKTCKLKKCN